MTIEEIASRVNNLASSWEEFKSLNERRLASESKRNSSDNGAMEMLMKISNSIDENKECLDRLEVASQRPNLSINNDDVFCNSSSYKDFTDYLRDGKPGLENKSMSFSNSTEGGVLAPQLILKYIESTLLSLSPMRKISSVEKLSASSMEFIVSDLKGAFAGWRGELENIQDDTTTPKIRKIIINCYELYAQPQVSKKILEDSVIDISKWLLDQLLDIFSQVENNAFIVGDGISKPKGILKYDTSDDHDIHKIQQITANALNSDAIVSFYYSLREEYASRANFLVNRGVLQNIRLLKTKNDQYLWQPGLSVGTTDTLMGVPIYQSSDMPNYASNSRNIIMALGDFKTAYKIIDQHYVRVMRDPYTSKQFVKFYTTKSVGGALIDGRAIKLLKV